MGKAQDWIRFGLAVVCLIAVIVAGFVLLGPQSTSDCFSCEISGGYPPPIARPPTTVPTPDKMPGMEQRCKVYAVPMC